VLTWGCAPGGAAAKAIAGEAGVPFFSCAASEFVELFVGVGASRVRDLFEKVRTRGRCLRVYAGLCSSTQCVAAGRSRAACKEWCKACTVLLAPVKATGHE